jgi:hypothetical protein
MIVLYRVLGHPIRLAIDIPQQRALHSKNILTPTKLLKKNMPRRRLVPSPIPTILKHKPLVLLTDQRGVQFRQLVIV